MIGGGLICISDIMLVILPDGVDLDPRPGHDGRVSAGDPACRGGRL